MNNKTTSEEKIGLIIMGGACVAVLLFLISLL